MSIYPSHTSITGGNVQFGDTNIYQYHNYHVLPQVDDDRTVLAWLSNLNFGEVLRRHSNKRTAGTGTWLIGHHTYKSWHASESDSDRVIWCRGHPGTGKTILCSVVIEHLQSTTTPDEAVLFCFFDYARRQELSVDMILSEFMAQLASRRIPQVFSILRDIYVNSESNRRRPTLKELTSAFHRAISSFRRVSIVVDALDECDPTMRRQLLTAMDLLHNDNVRVLIFSRPHIQIHTYVDKANLRVSEIDIQASASDLRLFVDSRITENEDLESVMDTCDVTIGQIADIVVAKASFSFLAAEMRLNAIGFVLTAEDLGIALESGLSDPTALYMETLRRIKSQHEQKAELALRVLGWLSVVKRPLTVGELCHVLAIQPGEQGHFPGRMPAPDVVINSCFGLVIKDSYTEQVRLLHYTLLEFVERHGLMSITQEAVVHSSLTCLSATILERLAFEVPPTASRLAAMHMQILRELPFSSYAANNWFDHMYADSEGLDLLISYLSNLNKVVAWLRLIDFHDPRRLRRLFRHPFLGRDPCSDSFPGLRIAMAMGWRTSVRRLRTATSFTVADLRIMLSEGLDKKSSKFLEMLLVEGMDNSFMESDGGGLVHQAVARDFEDAIPVLDKYGANLNQRNLELQTPLQVSILDGHEHCSVALLQLGASVNEMDESDNTTLDLGETKLHQVLRYFDLHTSQESIVQNLLNQGADIDEATVHGHTVLDYACIWSAKPEILGMILDKYVVELQSSGEDEFLHRNPLVSPDMSISCDERKELASIIRRYSNHSDPCVPNDANQSKFDCAEAVTNLILRSVSRRHAYVDYLDLHKRSPLHRAVEARRGDSLSLLLKAGVNANRQDYDGKTALHMALETLHLDQVYVELLFDHTSSLTAKDKAGHSLLEYAISRRPIEDLVIKLLPHFGPDDGLMSNRFSFLVGAITAGHSIAVIEAVLLRFPAQLNSRNRKGMTAINIAASRRRRDVSELLLRHGADLFVRDGARYPALRFLLAQDDSPGAEIIDGEMLDIRLSSALSAVAEQSLAQPPNLIQELLQRIADVSELDSIGRTTLHFVIVYGYPISWVETIVLGLEDINVRDSLGNSALHTAISSMFDWNESRLRSGLLSVPELLLRRGIGVNLQNKDGITPLLLLVKELSYATFETAHVTRSIACDLFETLLHYDADLFIRDRHDQSTLSFILNAWSRLIDRSEDRWPVYLEKIVRRQAMKWPNLRSRLVELNGFEVFQWSCILASTSNSSDELTQVLQELGDKWMSVSPSHSQSDVT